MAIGSRRGGAFAHRRSSEADLHSPGSKTVWYLYGNESSFERIAALLKPFGVATVPFRGSPAKFVDEFHASAGCVMTGLHLPEMSGIAVLQALRQRGVMLPLIIVSDQGTIPLAVHAIRAGAFDFLEIDSEDALIAERVLAALQRDSGEAAAARGVSGQAPGMAMLSTKEKMFGQLLCDGYSSKQIADKVFLSARTVEGYRRRIMSKLGVGSFAKLVRVLAT